MGRIIMRGQHESVHLNGRGEDVPKQAGSGRTASDVRPRSIALFRRRGGLLLLGVLAVRDNLRSATDRLHANLAEGFVLNRPYA